MTALLMGAQGASRLLRPRPGAPPRPRLIGSMALAAVYASTLAAGQVLPSLDLASRSDRWGLALEERTYWSLHPATLLQVLLPVSWTDLPLKPEIRALLFESREPLLFSIYLGLPACALAWAGLLGPARPLRRTLALAALLAVLFALGRNAPFYGAAVALLPPLGILRFPSKAMVLVAFCVALLSGMGFDAWRMPAGPRWRWLAFMAAPLVVIVAAGMAGVWLAADWAPVILLPPASGSSFAQAARPLVERTQWAVVTAVLFLGLVWMGRRGGRGALITGALASTLAVAVLAHSHRDLNPTAPKELFTFRPALVDALRQEDGRRLYVYDYLAARGRSRKHLDREVPYLPVLVYGQAPHAWAGAIAYRMYLLPPLGAAWKVYDSHSRDNLGIQPTEIAQLMAVLSYAEDGPYHLRLLRLGAVSQVVALHTRGLEDLVPERELPGPFLEPIRLFAVPSPLPRTYVVSGVRIADGQAGLDTLLDPSFDPAREVILPGGTPRTAGPGLAGSSRIVEYQADRLRLEVELAEPGWVVLVDTYDPGWKVQVDGAEATLLRANVGFRAIALGAGRHRVDMRYRPRAVPIGLGMSALAAGLGLVLAARRLVPAIGPGSPPASAAQG